MTTSLTGSESEQDDYPQTRLSRASAAFFRRLAGAISWLWLALIGVVVLNVVMRYAFGEGRVEFEEIQWHLYALGFMLGIASCFDADQHIRVDVLHDRAGARTRAWIELYGLLLLFLPFVLALLVFSIPFVRYSFNHAEVSGAAGGLPFRWLIKSLIPLCMLLLLVAGISRLSRILAYLFGWPRRVD